MRWTAPIAVAAGLVAFVGFGADYLAGRGADDSSDSAASTGLSSESERKAGGSEADSGAGSSGPQILASGTDYALGTLAAEPVQTLDAPGLKSSSTPRLEAPSRAVPAEPALQRLRSGSALQDCLDEIQRANAGGAISVQTVDFARFEGTPAVVVRFVADNGQWAWASGADCGASGSGAATLGKVPVR